MGNSILIIIVGRFFLNEGDDGNKCLLDVFLGGRVEDAYTQVVHFRRRSIIGDDGYHSLEFRCQVSSNLIFHIKR